ncbi:catalase [Kocuria palustris]|jgi:catalase|uniref:Catalase n=1 Tax=Kocuria palustris PEL TaxID=1236550 RepID=M2X8X8_9MICC|nr:MULTISPECIES: catalase [Kocuria]ALB03212.1 catalase [Kocuria palustris]EME35586.1 Catalase [Kocuria palustris PEL]MBN6752572.1 catalase [Kocuria palustris]MBN6757527.1 catalase [Kocuria palustris]MBN6762555.1 catalase [Kocuria palustris]
MSDHRPELPQVPGVPGSEPASAQEPVQPRSPLPPKPDQSAPQTRTATGEQTGAPEGARAQQGEFLTTAHGTRLSTSEDSLRAGRRGPALLQDHHFREKVSHFDHERIPERVVHARGAGAHGVFESYGTASRLSSAGVFAEGKQTPVFVRFSTVLGSRGSGDLARDTRGFATKFYTDEGTWDLVGNNIPVFFIQDPIKFPDVIHAAKPHPDREIPQAQSAHDTFWDFVSLHTEAQHHTIWNMADRGIPRSLRMMEGFGVHTFRLVAADGSTSLVKFHWKPRLGVHSVLWEEAQLINGADPDMHRRDLADAIEAGAHPQWELGVQVFPDTEDETFQGIDLLDPTKLVPEELAPVEAVGLMTLTANPSNYFAETEQVAFNPNNLVPGIDVTNDPLLQGRLFSYLDTQITRLGGPNWTQLPINRPHAPVNDMLRDGMHQSAVHSGVAPYRPNSLDGGNPFETPDSQRPFIDVAQPIAESVKERRRPQSFEDHFSQARMFWLSLSEIEREHTAQGYMFELGKCWDENVRIRQLQHLSAIDAELGRTVAEGLGLPEQEPTTAPAQDVQPSPALSQLGRTWPVDGRQIGILVGSRVDGDSLAQVIREIDGAGMVPLVIAPTGGTAAGDVVAQRTLLTARSVEFDAVLVASDPLPGPDAAQGLDAKAAAPSPQEVDPRASLLLQEVWRQAKPMGAWGTGIDTLGALGMADGAGVTVAQTPQGVLTGVKEALTRHRVWDRFPTTGRLA